MARPEEAPEVLELDEELEVEVAVELLSSSEEVDEAVLVDLVPEAVAVELPPPKGAPVAPAAPVAEPAAPPVVTNVVGTAPVAEETTPPGCWETTLVAAPLADGAGAWRAAEETATRARTTRVLGEYILMVWYVGWLCVFAWLGRWIGEFKRVAW